MIPRLDVFLSSCIESCLLTIHIIQVSLVIDWVPIFQFVFYAIISTPPNFMW